MAAARDCESERPDRLFDNPLAAALDSALFLLLAFGLLQFF
jgi:hypothetical protein